MKYYELDPEEKEMLESYERREWKSAKNQSQMRAMLKETARNTFIKRKINISK